MPVFSNVQTIVWDLDGTLLDSFGIHIDIMTQVLRKYGRPEPTYDQLRRNFHGKLEDSMKGLAGEHTSDDELAAMLDDFLRIDNEYIQDVDHHLFVDAVGLVKQAGSKGIRQIVVTNRAHGVNRGKASPRTMIEHSILRGYISTVICGDEVHIRKPNPKVLGEDHQIDPARTLVLGDQAVDAIFAHNFGARAVLVNRFEDDIHHMETFYQSGGDNDTVTIVKALSDITLQ